MLRPLPAPINGVRPASPVPLGCCGQFARATQAPSPATALCAPAGSTTDRANRTQAA